MAHTDVHAPWRAKIVDPAWRHLFREHHDHSRGPCTLAAWLATHPEQRRHRGCYLHEVSIGRNVNCGCRLCTMHDYRKVGNGKDRARWRADRQRLLRNPEHEPHHRRHPAW